jgi:3-hydroxyacyl-[acyl-carrier-protein] dehydratase
MELGIPEILKIQKNRHPLLFIDKVIDIVPGKSATAIKNYSYNEWFFPPHFKDDPNVPGFIQIESLVQTFIMTFLSIEGNQDNKTNFLKINNATFKKKIVPGDVSTIYAELESFKRGLAKGKARSEVDGEIACKAEFLVSLPAILDSFKPK